MFTNCINYVILLKKILFDSASPLSAIAELDGLTQPTKETDVQPKDSISGINHRIIYLKLLICTT